jgi:hypothetical protein
MRGFKAYSSTTYLLSSRFVNLNMVLYDCRWRTSLIRFIAKWTEPQCLVVKEYKNQVTNVTSESNYNTEAPNAGTDNETVATDIDNQKNVKSQCRQVCLLSQLPTRYPGPTVPK